MARNGLDNEGTPIHDCADTEHNEFKRQSQ